MDTFQFDDFSLEPDQMLQASLRMFIDCGFIDEFHIDYEVKPLVKSVCMGYRSFSFFYGTVILLDIHKFMKPDTEA